MPKLKIFAREIRNLTDARYFAAMGVEALGFELASSNPGKVNPEFVRQVSDWISGPSLIGCFSGFEPEGHIKKLISDAALDGLCFEPFVDSELIGSIDPGILFCEIRAELLNNWQPLPDARLIIRFDKGEELLVFRQWIRDHDINPATVYLDGPMDKSIIRSDWVHELGGIVLRGGDEEKTGFKSFDSLDEIFEWINS